MTHAQIQARPGFQIKGWHVLAAMLLFFGGDIVVNTVFMVDAYSDLSRRKLADPL